MRILRNEILACRVEVRKITSPAAGYDNLASDLGIMLNDKNFTATFPSLDRAKQPGCTAADDNGVINHLNKITLFQNSDVMPYMSGHSVDKSTG